MNKKVVGILIPILAIVVIIVGVIIFNKNNNDFESYTDSIMYEEFDDSQVTVDWYRKSIDDYKDNYSISPLSDVDESVEYPDWLNIEKIFNYDDAVNDLRIFSTISKVGGTVLYEKSNNMPYFSYGDAFSLVRSVNGDDVVFLIKGDVLYYCYLDSEK